ncbi:hypothetical protein LOTGIDRAFT_111725 [Lottia gigantea]|uniref:Fucosyltransferase n=1 Tax=Lottia gigantea TaxID=225164 RepID=V4CH60_LOTGI|nr:hypothetical protein LOTGIDRAFT_111725 [Lottia gigantea]ESP01435.1 hypothetical protein LOTGIDRAFT_111725 [Lottia gigantea]
MELLSLNPGQIKKPIILWWTPFTGEKGKYKTCGDQECFFTINRKFRNHPHIKVFMFYGSDFSLDDLPLPRQSHHEWGLFHEESPKNNFLYSHHNMMALFNHTCTFRRESDYPITTQHLVSQKWLESTKHLVSADKKHGFRHKLAPVVFTHSDCDTPSDRDTFVSSLMKHIKVDSYGSCLHNKDLPEHIQDPIKGMNHGDFLDLVSKYKFSLAIENGVCTDYVTEKLWRPLSVGSVPIVYGSPTVQELLPSNHSAIIINDYKTVEELAKYLTFLDNNNEEYEKYLDWKKTGVTNQILKQILAERDWKIDDNQNWSDKDINFVDGFECFVCKRVHENINLQKQGKQPKQHQANKNHYGCPKPKRFNESPELTADMDWQAEYELYGRMAKHLRYFIENNKTFTKDTLLKISLNDMS